MRIAFICCTFFIVWSARTEAQTLQDFTGKPIFLKKYDSYEGSPYLFREWFTGNVITVNGKRYDGLQINVDLYGNTPLFMGNDSIYSFVENVKELMIQQNGETHYFKKGILIDKNLPDQFMQVLSSEPLVLKHPLKTLSETTSYGTGTQSYRFVESNVFYAAVDGKIEKIKLTKADAQRVFSKTWLEIESFAAKNNISFKTEEGWKALIKLNKSLLKQAIL